MAKNPAVLFNPKEWLTPNTYDKNFKYPINKSGIYFIVLPKSNPESYEILYIGSAKNLAVRYARHEVMRMLREFYGYVQFYFREEVNYRSIEKELIKKIQPRFNKQWR